MKKSEFLTFGLQTGLVIPRYTQVYLDEGNDNKGEQIYIRYENGGKNEKLMRLRKLVKRQHIYEPFSRVVLIPKSDFFFLI